MTRSATNGSISRRDFVRTTSALGAVAAVSPLAAGKVHAAGRDVIKVGLIGCGGRGSGAAWQAIAADPGVVLYALGDVFADRLESCHTNLTNQLRDASDSPPPGRAFHTEQIDVPESRRFVGFDAFLRVIDEVDVVLLATPPHFRPQHLAMAVAAKRHVFCEKPMAVDAPGLRSVIESARQAKAQGTNLMSGFCWRYSDPERETFGKIEDGALGDIRAVYTTYNTGGWGSARPRGADQSAMEWQLRNWHNFTWLSGDHIVEQACHSIDKLAWAMLGELPTRCTAVGGRQVRDRAPETGHIFDHFAVTYDYASGAKGFHMCRHWPGGTSDNTDYIMGEKGTCFVNGWDQRSGHVIKTGSEEWRWNGSARNMYQTEHDELFKAIRSGTPVNDGSFMASSCLMAIMGRMAAYSGQTVTWEQAMNSNQRLGPTVYEWGDVPLPMMAIPGSTKAL